MGSRVEAKPSTSPGGVVSAAPSAMSTSATRAGEVGDRPRGVAAVDARVEGGAGGHGDVEVAGGRPAVALDDAVRLAAHDGVDVGAPAASAFTRWDLVTATAVPLCTRNAEVAQLRRPVMSTRVTARDVALLSVVPSPPTTGCTETKRYQVLDPLSVGFVVSPNLKNVHVLPEAYSPVGVRREARELGPLVALLDPLLGRGVPREAAAGAAGDRIRRADACLDVVVGRGRRAPSPRSSARTRCDRWPRTGGSPRRWRRR